MYLRRLGLAEMHAITGTWLHRDEALLLSIPELAGLHERIRDAHSAVERCLKHPEGVELEALQATLGDLDDRHDHTLLALWHGLSGSIAFARAQNPPDEPSAVDLERLLERLLPDGVGGLCGCNQQQVQDAAAAIGGLRAADMLTLRQTDLFGTKALAIARMWGALSDSMGQLLTQGKQAQASGASAISEATSGWVRVVETVLNVLDIARVSDAQRAQLRAAVCEAQAAVRAALVKEALEFSPLEAGGLAS